MRTAAITAATAAGLWLAASLQDISRAFFGAVLDAAHWLQAHPERFMGGVVLLAVVFVLYVNRKAPRRMDEEEYEEMVSRLLAEMKAMREKEKDNPDKHLYP